MANIERQDSERMLRKLARDIVRGIERAERKSADTGVKIAKDLSSGRKSLKQLAREDHPFAQRHGRPKDSPGIINTQRGVFRSGWRAVAQAVNGQVVPVVKNDTDVADFLKGPMTKSPMFARPIDSSVGSLLEHVRMENLKTELSKLEK